MHHFLLILLANYEFPCSSVSPSIKRNQSGLLLQLHEWENQGPRFRARCHAGDCFKAMAGQQDMGEMKKGDIRDPGDQTPLSRSRVRFPKHLEGSAPCHLVVMWSKSHCKVDASHRPHCEPPPPPPHSTPMSSACGSFRRLPNDQVCPGIENSKIVWLTKTPPHAKKLKNKMK